MRNPWKTLKSTPIYDNPWFSVRRDEVIQPDGRPGVYSVVSANRLACGILPLWQDNSITLVGQYRYPIDLYTWEIPEGGGPLDVDSIEIAKQELIEETGLVAGQWTDLGSCHLSNCFLDEICHLYLARDLQQHEKRPDGNEKLTTRRVPLEEAIAMAVDGRITDAISLAGLFRLSRYLDTTARRRPPDYFRDMPEEYQQHPSTKGRKKIL